MDMLDPTGEAGNMMNEIEQSGLFGQLAHTAVVEHTLMATTQTASKEDLGRNLSEQEQRAKLVAESTHEQSGRTLEQRNDLSNNEINTAPKLDIPNRLG